MTHRASGSAPSGSSIVFFEPRVARAARAYTKLGHTALAKAANVATRTVFKLERDGNITHESLEKILKALAECGVTMIYKDRDHVVGLKFKC